ncbi:MAG: metal ABC transporter permease [Pirellulaceae bacterium]|nr:metal ABC transporter permease [Pirellulaceae bacterium]
MESVKSAVRIFFRGLGLCGLLLATLVTPTPGLGQVTDDSPHFGASFEDGQRFSLADYNTQIVVFGAGLLGFAAGLVGCFALLRRQALVGDALSHATLPGIAGAFILVSFFGGNGKGIGWLLLGATITGVFGTLVMIGIQRLPRLKPDTSLGIVLSVFFGAGIVLITLAQQMESGHAAGLESFIYGKAASMLRSDAQLIAITALGVSLLVGLFFKELKLLCFDEGFAVARGYSRFWLDGLVMGLVTIVTVIGLQAVGLILIIALLVTPAAAARFWTNSLGWMCLISATFGAAASVGGALLSAWATDLPSGAMIVLMCSGIFVLSLLFGPTKGIIFKSTSLYHPAVSETQ